MAIYESRRRFPSRVGCSEKRRGCVNEYGYVSEGSDATTERRAGKKKEDVSKNVIMISDDEEEGASSMARLSRTHISVTTSEMIYKPSRAAAPSPPPKDSPDSMNPEEGGDVAHEVSQHLYSRRPFSDTRSQLEVITRACYLY